MDFVILDLVKGCINLPSSEYINNSPLGKQLLVN